MIFNADLKFEDAKLHTLVNFFEKKKRFRYHNGGQRELFYLKIKITNNSANKFTGGR